MILKYFLQFREGIKHHRKNELDLNQDEMARLIKVASHSYKRIEQPKPHGRGYNFGMGIFEKLVIYLQSANQFDLLLLLMKTKGFDVGKLERGFKGKMWIHLSDDYPPDGKRVPVACRFLSEPEIDTARYFSDSGKWQTTTLGIYAWLNVELPPIPGMVEKAVSDA